MKKLLLSLFCLLAVAASTATAHAEDLAATLAFDTWDNSVKNISSYTTTWDCVYDSKTWSIANFNNNNKGWNSIKCGRGSGNTSVAGIITKFAIPEKLSKVTINIATLTSANEANVNSIKLFLSKDGSNWTDTGLTFTAKKGTQSVEIPEKAQIENAYAKIEFDLKAASNGFVEINKVEYYNVKASIDPTVMSMTAKDLSIPFHETKSLDNITFTPEISVGDLYTLTFSGDYGDALEFSGDSTNGYTVYGKTTGKYSVKASFEGTSGTVAGKTGETSFNVTVGKDLSVEYVPVTDIADLGEKANVLIVSGNYIMSPSINKYATATTISFKENGSIGASESWEPFVVTVNPENNEEFSIKLGTSADAQYLNCAESTSTVDFSSSSSTPVYWNISCTSTSSTIKRSGNTIRFNSGATPVRFKTYSTGTGVLPQLYVDKSSVKLKDKLNYKLATTDIKDSIPFHATVDLADYIKATNGYESNISLDDLSHYYDDGSFKEEYSCSPEGLAEFFQDETTGFWKMKAIGKKGGNGTITATISAKSGNKNYKETCTFSFIALEDPLPEGNEFEFTQIEAVTVEEGHSQPIHIQLYPSIPKPAGPEDYIRYEYDETVMTIKDGVLTGLKVNPDPEVPYKVTVKAHALAGPDKCHEFTGETTFDVYVIPETPRYTLVTDIAQLGREAKVYIISNTARKIMGAASTADKIRTAMDLKERDITDEDHIVFYEDEYTEFTVAKKPNTKIEEGCFSFYDNKTESDNKYLYSSASTELQTVANPSYARLTISEIGNAVIQYTDNSGQIRYSTGKNQFASYKSTDKNYLPVQLYVRAKSMKPIDEYEMFMTATPIEVPYSADGSKVIDNITFTPSLDNYENISFTYSSNPEGIVEIDEETKTISGKLAKGGETDVTANFTGYRDGELYTCSVVFHVTALKAQSLEEAEFSVAENIVAEIGEPAVDLKLHLTPDFTEEEVELIYDHNAIQIEDYVNAKGFVEGGKVTGLVEGEHKVTVKLNAVRGVNDYRGKEFNFTVTVKPAPLKYYKVTDLKQLGKCATVVIAAAPAAPASSTTSAKNEKWVMGYQNASSKKYRDHIDATSMFATDNSWVKHVDTYAVLEVVRNEDGLYSFQEIGEGKGQYFNSTGKTATSLSDTPVYWNLSFKDGNLIATINNFYLRANPSDPRFTTYESGNMSDIQLYMLPKEPVPATPVTLHWEDILDQTISSPYNVTAELDYKEGNYSLMDIIIQLKADNAEFPVDDLDVIVTSVDHDNEAYWVDDTFIYNVPEKYQLEVKEKENSHLSEDWEITAPKKLIVNINKMTPDFFEKFSAPLEMDHVASVYEPATDEEGKVDPSQIGNHKAQDHYFTFYDESVFFPKEYEDLVNFQGQMKANFTTSQWNEKKDAGLIDESNPADHQKWHHLYYEEPSEVIVDHNELLFTAHQPGQYTLSISVDDQYKDWFEPTYQDYLINLRPSVEGVGITKMGHKEVNGVLGFEFGYYETDFPAGDYPTSNDHEYYETCQIVRTHGGDVYFDIIRDDAPAYLAAEYDDPTNVTDEDLTHYTKAEFSDENPTTSSNTLNLRNAKGISLAEDVNGVRTATPYVEFDTTNVPTLVEEISAIEVAEGETLYFTLQGIRVNADRLVPGIYVRRTATSTGLILIP